MIGRLVCFAPVLFASCVLILSDSRAQDVPGIEICTVEKTMERRTSCLQSNVDFLQKTTPIRASLRGAKRRSNPFFLVALDCFASLAMTRRTFESAQLFSPDITGPNNSQLSPLKRII